MKLKELMQTKEAEEKNKTSAKVAVIGIGCEFSNCKDHEKMWENIAGSVNLIKEFPSHRKDLIQEYVSSDMNPADDNSYLRAAYVDDIEYFDYKFFHMTPRDAQLLNPEHRKFLQCAVKALQDAGYGEKNIYGTKTGVYVGNIEDLQQTKYQEIIKKLEGSITSQVIPATLSSMMPSRLSFFLDLQGPTISINTACSSSLVAVHTAYQSILNGECEMAVAGASRIENIPLDTQDIKLGIESSDGETRTFDHQADGSGMGEGTAAVLLKDYDRAIEDKDHIYATICASALNQDGSGIGITVPNEKAQTDVILSAWDKAKIHPDTIQYIETHGTATNLGDPIELNGLIGAFKQRTEKKQFCAIGAVKSNMGHLYQSAGIASFIKVVMALNKQKLPPAINYVNANKKADLIDSALYINDRVRDWSCEGTRRAGVSSFGLSGTNCHMILEEHIASKQKESDLEAGQHLFVASAGSENALRQYLMELNGVLTKKETQICLKDLCGTFACGRFHLEKRVAMISRNLEDLSEKIKDFIDGKYNDEISTNCALKEDEDSLANNRNKTKKLTDDAVKINDKIENIDEINVRKLCELYVGGADIDWNLTYGNSYWKKSLPVLPFEKKKCWVKGTDIKVTKEPALFQMSYKEILPLGEIKGFLDVTDQNIMVIGNEPERTKQWLKESGLSFRSCTYVFFDKVFEQLSEKEYRISPELEDYRLLFQQVKMMDMDRIIFLGKESLHDADAQTETFKGDLNNNVYSFFSLTKALLEIPIKSGMELNLVTKNSCCVDGYETMCDPLQFSLLGLGKVVRNEYDSFRCSAYDMDSNTGFDELYHQMKTSQKYLTIIRGRHIYHEYFAEIDENKTENRSFDVIKDGVYLITGGLGGIGYQLAQMLTQMESIHLIIIGRRTLDESSELMARMKALEKSAAVSYFCGDASDLNFMKQVFYEVNETYGRLDGMIHSAGVSGKGLIVGKTKEEFQKVYEGKVSGAWNLHYLSKQFNPSWFLMCSSAAALFGEAGQSDYVSANSYLDALASYRNHRGYKTLAINWVVWNDTGMGITNNMLEKNILFQTMSSKEAIYYLKKVLNKNISNVLIGKINYQSNMIHFLSDDELLCSSRIKEQLRKEIDGEQEKACTATVLSEYKVLGRPEGDYSLYETNIAKCCMEVLKMDSIHIFDNFYSMGVDSLALKSIHGKIEEVYKGKLALANMYAYSTVADIAKHLEENMEDKTQDTATEFEHLYEDLEKGDIDAVLNSMKNLK